MSINCAAIVFTRISEGTPWILFIFILILLEEFTPLRCAISLERGRYCISIATMTLGSF